MITLPRPTYARKLFDIGWNDFARAGCYSICSANPRLEQAAVRRLEQVWAPSRTLVTLSVRSAFDLLLQACALPTGSEVIVSAVTIPHMIAIIELHGLIPVPVDLEEKDSSVLASHVEDLVTPRTKAILIAQLFGHRHCLKAIAKSADRHNLLLIEDCAQAFCGLEFTGSPEAAVSLFSFGPIKTCTSLAGGIATVREPDILGKMKSLQAGYPLQTQNTFRKKVVKYAAFKGITESRYCYGTLIWILRRGGRDHHEAITKASHSLAANVDLRQQIRFRPSVALLELLHNRIVSFDRTCLQQRRARIEDLVDRLPSHLQPIGYQEVAAQKGSCCPYWICPIRVENPRLVLDKLLEAGFDAAAGDASLTVVARPNAALDEEKCTRLSNAENMMSKVIYLPVDNIFSDRTVNKMTYVLMGH
ncbi:GDP-perosamine synthase [Paramyrothecium foliicola]|nr:GDP-perosamine synthase [Paramyrothecium foliicola]